MSYKKKLRLLYNILALFGLWICFVAMTHQNNYINPTGTYKLDSKTTKKGKDVYGYTGEIKVKMLTKNKIVMSFIVCKGAPSYNSGSFLDTLDYKDNRSIYTDLENDSSCMMTFKFTDKGVIVDEKTDDYNFGCGFGHAVVADGYFKKTSALVPLIKDFEAE